jgi:acyl carrier protein
MSDIANDTLARLRATIADACAVPPDLVVPPARLRAYGIDSVRVMSLMLTIEDQFGVRFDLEELERVKTVGDLVAYVDRLQRKAGPASGSTERTQE